MKIKLFLMIALVVAGAVGCGGDESGPPKDPTPVPEPEPTAVVVPCAPTGVGAGNRAVWRGDCVASSTCRDGGDGFFYGNDCRTR